mmetsp:Transcript_45294/g.61828  ORF Transcript_45294/g.61828 Transcript_45294/m.61828 type:complete len:266 (-) Transcript_45294:1074-1871(-)
MPSSAVRRKQHNKARANDRDRAMSSCLLYTRLWCLCTHESQWTEYQHASIQDSPPYSLTTYRESGSQRFRDRACTWHLLSGSSISHRCYSWPSPPNSISENHISYNRKPHCSGHIYLDGKADSCPIRLRPNIFRVHRLYNSYFLPKTIFRLHNHHIGRLTKPLGIFRTDTHSRSLLPTAPRHPRTGLSLRIYRGDKQYSWSWLSRWSRVLVYSQCSLLPKSTRSRSSISLMDSPGTRPAHMTSRSQSAYRARIDRYRTCLYMRPC